VEIKGADLLNGKVHVLGNAQANELQAAYIRHVVDTVNDLDNVLYEVINEGGEREWDWWVVRTIRQHEAAKPNRHPIGITGHGAERVESMLASPADWISPGRADGYAENPPAWDGRKVSLLDTDHIWGVGGNVGWVWKSFLRGHHPLFMDPYDGSVLGEDRGWEPIRSAMGHTRRWADRVNLAAMSPRADLASTQYCLANPGVEYLVYQPAKGAEFMLELEPGIYQWEWFDPGRGMSAGQGRVESKEGAQKFKAPFPSDGVLHLKAVVDKTP
jgi:hypothetical protein